jgi:hypothetical protein
LSSCFCRAVYCFLRLLLLTIDGWRAGSSSLIIQTASELGLCSARHLWLLYCTSGYFTAPLATLLHLWLLYCTSGYFTAPLATLLHLWLRYCLLYYRVFGTQEPAALQRLLYCSSFAATRQMRVAARKLCSKDSVVKQALLPALLQSLLNAEAVECGWLQVAQGLIH